jgi:tetratricopeptide (TPR) repeat protein
MSDEIERRTTMREIHLQRLLLSYVVLSRGIRHSDSQMLMDALANAYERLGLFHSAIPLRRQLLEIAREVLVPEDPATLLHKEKLAHDLSHVQAFAESGQLFEEIVDAQSKRYGSSAPPTLTTLSYLSAALTGAGQYESALGIDQRVVDAVSATNGDRSEQAAVAKADMAVTLKWLDRYGEAVTLEEDIVDVLEGLFGSKDIRTVRARRILAESTKTGSSSAPPNHEALNEEARLYIAETEQNILSEGSDGEGQVSPLSFSEMAENARIACAELIALRSVERGQYRRETVLIERMLAWALLDLGRVSEARSVLEEVINRTDAAQSVGQQPQRSLAMSQLAELLDQEGRSEIAIQCRREVLKRESELHGPETDEMVNAVIGLASSLTAAGEGEEALALLGDALKVRRDNAIADASAGSQHILRKVGLAMKALGDYEGALIVEESVSESSDTIFGPDDAFSMDVAMNLAFTYKTLGQIEEAERIETQVLERRIVQLGPDHPDTVRARAALSVTAILQEDNDRGLALARLNVDLCNTSLGITHPLTLRSRQIYAVVLHASGEEDAAVTEATKLRREALEQLGSDHPIVVSIAELLSIWKDGDDRPDIG